MTTARDIERAIFDKYLYQQNGWAVLREVSIDTDEPTRSRRRRPRKRRIDILLMRIGRRSRPLHERLALEIKVSRSDFKRDTAEKRETWAGVADRFAYVTPAGMIRKDELPDGTGLMEYHDDALFGHQRLKWAVIAPRNPSPAPFTTQFFAYLMGRASRAEEQLRKAA